MISVYIDIAEYRVRVILGLGKQLRTTMQQKQNENKYFRLLHQSWGVTFYVPSVCVIITVMLQYLLYVH